MREDDMMKLVLRWLAFAGLCVLAGMIVSYE